VSVARFIADQRTFYRVPYAVCCVILGVSQSWFYKCLNHDSRRSSFLCGDSRRITMGLRRAVAQSLHPVRPSGARSDSVSGSVIGRTLAPFGRSGDAGSGVLVRLSNKVAENISCGGLTFGGSQTDALKAQRS
jgi:hypothetical protein